MGVYLEELHPPILRGGGREIDDARTLSSKNLVINFLRDGIINNDSRSLSDVS